MAEQTLKGKTAKGLFWGGISNGLQQVLQVIFGFMMLRLLTPGEFGIYGMLTMFPAIATIIQDSGFVTALINKKDICHNDYNAVFWFSSITSLIIYIILFLCAPLISNYFGYPVLISLSRILFLSIIISGIGIAQHIYLLKNLMIKEKAKVEILSVFISGIIGISLAYLGYSYWSIVIQNVTFFSVATITRWFITPWKPTLNINLKPLKEFLPFSMKLLVTGIAVKIEENIFSIVLGKYHTKQQVGFYSQGNKWAVMGNSLLAGMIYNIAQPVFVQTIDSKERLLNSFRKMIRFSALIAFPLLLGLAFVGKDFFLIIKGNDEWVPAVPFLQLFCIWYSIAFLWNLYVCILIIHNRSDLYMFGMLATLILQLIIIAVTFKYGILKMIAAYLCVYFISMIYWHYQTNKIIGVRLWQIVKDILPFLLSTIICILCTWFITKNIDNLYLRFSLKIIITATLYTMLMWFSNAVIVRECYSFFKAKITNKIW